MYRKNDKYLFGLSNVRASSPAGFKLLRRMTAHENNGIQGAMSKKGRANLGSAFFALDNAVLSLPRRSSPERPSSVPPGRDYGGWKGSRLICAKSDSTLDDFLDGFDYRIIIWLFRQLFHVLNVLNDTASIQNKN